MAALICGSLAFDTITTFPGRFADQILPEQLHILNVSFLVPTLRREFGGCAGNIAYNLAALGGEPVVMAAVGSDGARLPGAPARRGASTTELVRADRRQLHRAGDHHHRPRQQPDHRLPPGRDAVGARDRGAGARRPGARRSSRPTAATRCCGTPRSSPPPAFRSSSIRARACRCSTAPSCARFVEQASWVAVNDYEAQMLCERTGHDARGDVALAPARRRRHARRRKAASCGSDGERTHVPGVAATRGASIRPAAATPFAPRCCTASSAAGRWSAAPRSATGSARSRSPAAAARIMCWIARSSASEPAPRSSSRASRPKSADHGPPSRQSCSSVADPVVARRVGCVTWAALPLVVRREARRPPRMRLKKSDKGRLFSQQQTAQATPADRGAARSELEAQQQARGRDRRPAATRTPRSSRQALSCAAERAARAHARPAHDAAASPTHGFADTQIMG